MSVSIARARLPSMVIWSSGVSFSLEARKNGVSDSVVTRCSAGA